MDDPDKTRKIQTIRRRKTKAELDAMYAEAVAHFEVQYAIAVDNWRQRKEAAA